EERGVPVMVLTDPGEGHPKLGYGFIAGASLAEQKALVEEELQRRSAGEVKLVGASGFPCDSRPAYPGAPRFPVAQWANEGIVGALLLGDAPCARDVVSTASKLRRPFVLGLG